MGPAQGWDRPNLGRAHSNRPEKVQHHYLEAIGGSVALPALCDAAPTLRPRPPAPIGEEECFQLGGGRERLLADGSSRRFEKEIRRRPSSLRHRTGRGLRLSGFGPRSKPARRQTVNQRVPATRRAELVEPTPPSRH